MMSGRKTLRPSIYFTVEGNGSILYLKENINFLILLEFGSTN